MGHKSRFVDVTKSVGGGQVTKRTGKVVIRQQPEWSSRLDALKQLGVAMVYRLTEDALLDTARQTYQPWFLS